MHDESFAEISAAQLAVAKAALECLNSEVDFDRIREHLGAAASAIERAFHRLP